MALILRLLFGSEFLNLIKIDISIMKEAHFKSGERPV
jgi:hypothetical protein